MINVANSVTTFASDEDSDGLSDTDEHHPIQPQALLCGTEDASPGKRNRQEKRRKGKKEQHFDCSSTDDSSGDDEKRNLLKKKRRKLVDDVDSRVFPQEDQSEVKDDKRISKQGQATYC